jgi:OOP family OmpA-OmpF porin
MELKVLFDSGKAVVKPEYRSEIERVANFLSTYPEITAEIEGHTDNTGPDAVNQTISQQRADAVKAYLVKEFSVDTARVKATGYGETQPIADNTTAEGLNKRKTKRRRPHP